MNDHQSLIAVKLNAEFSDQCQQLSSRLDLALVENDQAELYSYLFEFSDKGLALQKTGDKAPGPVRVDLVSGVADHRRKRGGGELIVKAVAGNKQQLPSIVDATAGLGRDSFVLASWGYPVTLCERSPLVAALLEDGLQRAISCGDESMQEILSRMQLKNIDAMQYLKTEGRTNPPDVIVIDPMFPASKKSALVKKEMQAFHQLVGKDDDSDELLATAIELARHRVVVKRPKKAACLANRKPNFSVEGKAVRFDIYTIKAFEK